jgi:exopolysaccharide production protein ExoQ
VFFAILGKDATLTGRTKIWAAVMREIEDRPWLGYGYHAVWGDKSGWGPFAWISKNAGFQAQHAHNSWLEQWLGMGLLGLVAWGLFYLQAMALAVIAVFRDRGALLAFPFLVVFSLVALTESIAVTYNDFRWVLFVAFAAKLAFPIARWRTRPRPGRVRDRSRRPARRTARFPDRAPRPKPHRPEPPHAGAAGRRRVCHARAEP